VKIAHLCGGVLGSGDKSPKDGGQVSIN